MPLLRLDQVSLAYGHRPLLDRVHLEIRRGERVCLVGRNGEGKSSLMRLVSADMMPDEGSVWVRPGTRIGHLAQEITFGAMDTASSCPPSASAVADRECVFDIVAGGLAQWCGLLSQYHHAAAELAHTPSGMQRLAELQHRLEAAGAWQLERRVETVLSRLGLDGEASVHTLSGGWRRRVMLARALVSEPDLLLLDEPTNHLDIEAITWLEEFLRASPVALLFVSHDRAFLRRLAMRIVELDRGQLTSWTGDYDDYLRLKAEQLQVEARHNAESDKKLSREEAWIRQGVKARRTRNEGRVRALMALREQRRERRDRPGQADLRLEEAEQSGRLAFDAEHVDYSYGDTPVIRDFSVRILRGDRVGLIGPNGAGKTTLIKLLLGDLVPKGGRIRRGTRLQIAYYDQEREQLDPAATVMDSVAGGSPTVTINGRTRHVTGYLRDFLFPAERLQSPVSTLSGGERNRLMLARLFTRRVNLLVLDEPTNDLDVETLELLEELLLDYQGTLLLVSHDRAFLDNVVTSTLVFEGNGRIAEHVGGYSDWLRYQQDRQRAEQQRSAKATKPTRAAPAEARRPRKLSYKEQRELEALPGKIERLEEEQSRLHATVSEGAFYQQPAEQITATLAHLESITRELEACYTRWEALEAIATEAT